MVTENLGLAEELVRDPSEDTLRDLLNDHGAFASGDELDEFLRTFDEGQEDEAHLQVQGEGDIGGEPLSTVH